MESLTSTVASPVRQPLFPAAAVIGATGLALVGESIRSYAETHRLSTEAPTVLHDNNKDINMYVIGGCRHNAVAVASAMEPQYSAIANMAYITYPSRGGIIDGVATGLQQLSEKMPKAERTVVLAISMGALVLGEVMRDQDCKDAIGPIDTLLLDSSPSSLATVRRGVKLSLAAAGIPILRNSSTYNDITAWGVRRATGGRVRHHGPNITDESALQMFEAAVSAHNTSIYRQGLLIKQGDPTSVANIARQNYYLTAEFDGVVDTQTAGKDFGMQIIVDDERPSPSHAAVVEYSSAVKQLLAA